MRVGIVAGGGAFPAEVATAAQAVTKVITLTIR